MTHSFNPTELEAAATAQTNGLKNFGAPRYREALERLCTSLNTEANLSDFGHGLLHGKLIELLVNRLRIEDWFSRFPEIENEVIAPPLVIVGLPRTGTTLLQRVLAQDPALYSMAWWESRYPVPFPDESLQAPTQRMERARGEVAVMVQAMPKLMAIHPMNADEADEEVMLMEHSFRAAFNAYAHVPSYMQWLHSTDETPAYDYLQRVLKFLQWQKRQRGVSAARWVLKAPHHLLRMGLLLRLFPGAAIIQTHRDPVDTIPSIASFIHTLWCIYGTTPSATAAGQEWSALMARAFAHTDAVRAENPAPFFDVQFLDTVKKPLEVVRAIYAHCGMALSAEAEAAMQQWLTANGREARASHEYHAEDFGLSAAQIATDFAGYTSRHLR